MVHTGVHAESGGWYPMSSSVALPPFFLKQGISLSPELPLSAVSACQPKPRTLLSLFPQCTKLFTWILGIKPGPHVCMTSLLPTDLFPKLSHHSKGNTGAGRRVSECLLHRREGPSLDPQHHRESKCGPVHLQPQHKGGQDRSPELTDQSP